MKDDPLPKRLQRLELLTFGATQYGSNLERWRNIKHYISQAGTNKNNGNGQPQSSSAPANISTSLNALEKYVFKKTFSGEPTARRLDKLEAKLFGQPSTSMPAAERIARLQRTLGVNASPHEMAELPNGGLPPMFRDFSGDMLDPEWGGMNSQMAQMLQEMQRQMQGQGIDQLPGNGQYEFRYHIYGSPDGGFRIGPDSDPNITPNPGFKGQKRSPQRKQAPPPERMPDFNAPQMIPQPGPPAESIPSYNDPNFI